MQIGRPQHFKPRKQRPAIVMRFLLPTCAVILSLTACLLAYALTDNPFTSEALYRWAHLRGHGTLRDDISLRQALLRSPLRMLNARLSPEKIPRIDIDIKFRNVQKINKKRDEALHRGFLKQASGDFVPAAIRHAGRTIKVKVRLKGDLPDHLMGDKWSLRVHVKGRDQLFGMRRFSIQHPGTRAYQAELLFHRILDRLGVMAPRYFFVRVFINGNDIGIMALEEHFSKEMLAFGRRRESVIIKFDESLFWDEWMALGDKGPVFNSYKNTNIEAFKAGYIAKSQKLSEDCRIAVGLLRGFVDGSLPPSDVFDIHLMSRFMAAAEVFGADHCMHWNNLRFYFNPVTAKLEPIAYDNFRRRMSELRDEFIVPNEPITRAMLADRLILAEFSKTVDTLSDEILNGDLIQELADEEQRDMAVLRREFFLLEGFPFRALKARAAALRQKQVNPAAAIHDDARTQPKPGDNPRAYPVLLHANLVHDAQGYCIEFSNAVPHAVEIVSLTRMVEGVAVPFDAPSMPSLPLHLQPTPLGALPQIIRMACPSSSDIQAQRLFVTARLQDETKRYDTEIKSYYAPLNKNPVPSAPVTPAAGYSFIKADSTSRTLRVSPGTWAMRGDLIVPSGWSLYLPGGTSLAFDPHSGIVARGTLHFQGNAENPVVLTGVAAPDGRTSWKGVAVLNAGAQSQWDYVFVDHTTGIRYNGWELTAGITFYNSDIIMQHCTLSDNTAEDALNIIHSSFRLQDTRISDSVSDGLDCDFADGTITGGIFHDIGKAGGGDGVDVSGSRVTVKDTLFETISDKALSVGELSNLTAAGLTITRSGTGAACKDGSSLAVSNCTIREPLYAGFVAYTKKPEYGPARIDARNITFIGDARHARAQKGSIIFIDGVEVTPEDIDVEQLYQTIMRPGLR